jgi:adenylate cyclase
MAGSSQIIVAKPMDDLVSSTYLEIEIKSEVRRYPLVADKPCRIGRSEGNTIVLEDDLASRNHAILQATDAGVFYVTDVGSTNGTLLNGGRVTAPMQLKAGDCIQIGSHAFTFHQKVPAAPEPEILEQKATSLFVAMKVISVLVVDIRDFTGLGQRIGSEKLGEVAGALFREGGQVLQQHGAWAQKYIGDAVMAVWLHRSMMPEVDEVMKALQALNSLRSIAGALQGRFQLSAPIKIGAGMNTGPASIGNFGSIAASDHTALGDVVNKAFRLESATKEVGCDLVVGPETHAVISKAPGAAGLFTQSQIKLKGYNEPATVYGTQLSVLDILLGMIPSDRTTKFP